MRATRDACIETGTSASAIVPTISHEFSRATTEPDSKIVRVISSRKSGLPEARSRICQTTAGGSALSLATLRINISTSSVSSASSSICVTPAAEAQVGLNSGRAVESTNRRALRCERMRWSSNSTVDGSAQWRSSMIKSSGLYRVMACTQSRKISIVRRRATAGVRLEAGHFAGSRGREKSDAISGTVSPGTNPNSSMRRAMLAARISGVALANPSRREISSSIG